MKNSFFHSFRFEIVIYSFLSLIYTIFTEAGIFLGLYAVGVFAKYISYEGISPKGSVNINSDSLALKYSATNNLMESNNIAQEQILHKGYLFLIVGLAIIVGIVLFIVYFLLLTRRFSTYLGEILVGIKAVSNGDFNTRIEIKNEDEFAQIATMLNKMTDDLRILMESERKNEHTKNDLITSVAHDLRTPLTSIIGYLDLVKSNRALTEEEKDKYICVAYDKSKRLEKLIEDLFNYTKFSSGQVVPSVSAINMVKLMEQMVDEFYPSFQESQLEYDFYTNDSNIIVMADGDLMARAFGNLISNAVKYGKDGKSVRIKMIKNIDTVSITIINYGEVIPKEDLENIFNRFFRVENSRSRETGGTGLGLAIAKSIILIHGGSIKVTSDLEGTIFEIVLNIELEDKPEQISEV